MVQSRKSTACPLYFVQFFHGTRYKNWTQYDEHSEETNIHIDRYFYADDNCFIFKDKMCYFYGVETRFLYIFYLKSIIANPIEVINPPYNSTPGPN